MNDLEQETLRRMREMSQQQMQQMGLAVDDEVDGDDELDLDDD